MDYTDHTNMHTNMQNNSTIQNTTQQNTDNTKPKKKRKTLPYTYEDTKAEIENDKTDIKRLTLIYNNLSKSVIDLENKLEKKRELYKLVAKKISDFYKVK